MEWSTIFFNFFFLTTNKLTAVIDMFIKNFVEFAKWAEIISKPCELIQLRHAMIDGILNTNEDSKNKATNKQYV